MGAPSRAAGLLDVEILAFPEHLVGVYGLRRARGHYARAHDGRVAVTQRRAVVAFEMRDGRQVARLLDMVVRKPDSLEEPRARILEVQQIVGMVDDAHHVGLRIAYGDWRANPHGFAVRPLQSATMFA